MGRIVYGVMGDARGHVNRAGIIAREMSGHEFLFLGGGRARELESLGHRVEPLPMASTYYKNNRVDIPRTACNAVRVFLGSRQVVRRTAEIIDRFDPDLIVTDFEYFTPLAARRLGRFCVSLDHQHVITHCLYDPPGEERLSRLMTGGSVQLLYSNAHHFLVTSFFSVPPKNPENTEVLPPILRPEAAAARPLEGEHVLVYQTSPTFHRLLPALESVDEKFIIYGLGEPGSRRNLVFRPPSTEGFLHDLASSRCVITNGGHNVISEALHLGKPVFAFPIAGAYEQFINAFFLARLGYGAYSTSRNPTPDLLKEFLERTAEYSERISAGEFYGNQDMVKRLESLMGRGR